VLLLAALPVVPVVGLPVVLVAALAPVLLVGSVVVLVSGPVLGSEAILAARLQAPLAVAQVLTQGDLAVVLQAHLRVQVDLTVVLQQVGRRDVGRDHRSDLRRTQDAERDAKPLRR
jgi:hypothetical protein